MRLLAITLLLGGCGSPLTTSDDLGASDDLGPPDAATAPADLAQPQPDMALPTAWIDDVTTRLDGGIVVEEVTYLSGGFRVKAEVCHPDDNARHPVIVMNHGGFAGLGPGEHSACRSGAGSGYVMAAASYRGEDGSEGTIEVCRGEVDDVQAMMSVLRKQTYVEPTRFAAFGGSHGGCITLELALREKSLKAAVDYFGPGDLATQYTWWQNELAQNEPFCAARNIPGCDAVHQQLIQVIRTGAGGTPAQVPHAYAARSPGLRLGDLTVPTMILHGTEDFLVNVEQSCIKRDALTKAGKAPAAWYLDAALMPQNPMTPCGGNYRVDPIPTNAFPDDFYLFVFEAQGHGFTGMADPLGTSLALGFLLSRL